MHIIRDNRHDTEVQKAEKEPRFLWVITTWYHKAKKASGVTAEFWEGLREALSQFETPVMPPPVRQPTSPPPTRPRAKTPPATPPSSVGRPINPPPIRPTAERRRPWPMKMGTKRSAKDQMIVENEEEEEEEEEDEEEEEEDEEDEEEKEEEEEEEEEEKTEQGKRGEGKAEDDGWEGEEEVEVDTPVHHRRNADVNRRPPQPSQKRRDVPCQWCYRMARECLEQAQGIACWPCAWMKAKCEPGSRKWVKGEGKAAGTRKPAPTKKAKASKSKAGPSRPAPKPRRRFVKSTAYVIDSDEESKETKPGASRPAPAPESKASASRLAPAPESKAGPSRAPPAPAKKEGLFGSDEESEPLARKEKGKGKAGKSILPSVFYILIDLS
jgi:hypothetical protein